MVRRRPSDHATNHMQWYLAKLTFQIICGEGNHRPQFDEQLRLVSATCKKQALDKSLALGHKEQDVFYNTQDQLVQWNFIAVTELYKLNEWLDGSEVYSRIEETEHAEPYLDILYKKAEQLRNGNTHEILNLA